MATFTANDVRNSLFCGISEHKLCFPREHSSSPCHCECHAEKPAAAGAFWTGQFAVPFIYNFVSLGGYATSLLTDAYIHNVAIATVSLFSEVTGRRYILDEEKFPILLACIREWAAKDYYSQNEVLSFIGSEYGDKTFALIALDAE